MNIMNRRNAVIGYLALQALKRSRRNAAVGYLAAQGMEHTRARRSSRRALKVSLYVVLGIVSLGVLAAAAGFAAKRRSTTPPLEGRAAEAPAAEEATEAAADESVPAEAEPIPST
jgi:flagellar basal body-associated protein FliL